jgi:hypothetical protein
LSAFRAALSGAQHVQLDSGQPKRRHRRKTDLGGEGSAWLEQYPDLIATRLLEKLAGEGFAGRYTIVRQHLKTWRAAHAPYAPPYALDRIEQVPQTSRGPARPART